MKQLQRVCHELKTENEVAIITQYGKRAKHYTATIICEFLRGIFSPFK